MKYLVSLLVIIMVSCVSPNSKTKTTYRSNFSKDENVIIKEAKDVIEKTNFVSLITLNNSQQSRARVMEFFKPDATFEIWMGTNPKSRKVTQIKQNSAATLHYFDQSQMAYVSLMGNAYIVNDDSIKASKWKAGWEEFYPNKTTDYTLIRFIPETLEFVGIVKGFTGDKETWAPHRVVLRD